MKHDHSFYERQSALAATGHLTDAEVLKLEQHASGCISCRTYLLDMAMISRSLFLAQTDRSSDRTPPGMQARFLERATALGLPVAHQGRPSRGMAIRSARALAISASLAVLISFVAMSISQRSKVPATPLPLAQVVSQAPGMRTSIAASGSEGRVLRGAAIRRKANAKAASGRNADNFRFFAVLKAPLFSQPGLRSASRLPFVSGATSLNGNWDGRPEKRSFLLDLTQTEPLHPNWTLSASSGAQLPGLRFATPPFHPALGQDW